MWDGQGMEKPRTGFIGGLILGADRAGRDEGADIRIHGGPPKTLTEESKCTMYPWVAGQTGGVGPLEHLGTHRVRDKQTVGRTGTWVWLGGLGLTNLGLNLPGDSGHDTGGRQNGLWVRMRFP